MKKLKNYAAATIGFMLFVAIFVFSVPQSGHSKAGPDKDVRVINTTSQPVPVAVQGTSNVNVANSPTVKAQQDGTWNVGITGTPTVQFSNDENNPVFISDVNNKPQTPYQIEVEVNLVEGQGGENGFITVPPGKVFVIEQVSANGFAPDGQILQFSVGTRLLPDDVRKFHYLQTSKAENDTFTDMFTASQMVKLYADIASVAVRVTRNSSSGTANGRFTVSGYFVDK